MEERCRHAVYRFSKAFFSLFKTASETFYCRFLSLAVCNLVKSARGNEWVSGEKDERDKIERRKIALGPMCVFSLNARTIGKSYDEWPNLLPTRSWRRIGVTQSFERCDRECCLHDSSLQHAKSEKWRVSGVYSLWIFGRYSRGEKPNFNSNPRTSSVCHFGLFQPVATQRRAADVSMCLGCRSGTAEGWSVLQNFLCSWKQNASCEDLFLFWLLPWHLSPPEPRLNWVSSSTCYQPLYVWPTDSRVKYAFWVVGKGGFMTGS